MRGTLAPLALAAAVASACAAPRQSGAGVEVRLVEESDYGRGVFVIAPSGSSPQTCRVEVPADTGTRAVDCNTDYLVACAVEFPEDSPFCQLVREIGPERESAYPTARRK